MKFEKVSKEQFEICTDVYDYCDVKLPKRATRHSAGYDFFSVADFTLQPGESILLPTGIKVELDGDKFLMCAPRSSLGFKYRLQLDNTVGIIDADYYGNPKNEGHIFASITNDSKDKTLVVHKGEAFIQGIIIKYYTVDDDCTTEERVGGLGSTSK